jgi:hypothetical protein
MDGGVDAQYRDLVRKHDAIDENDGDARAP